MSSEIAESSGSLTMLTWLEVNKKNLLMTVVVLAVAGAATGLFWHFRSQKELAASVALMQLTRPLGAAAGESVAKPSDYLAVADNYPGTGAAERALLLGAGQLFSEGKYVAARTKFEQFASTYPASELLPTARLGSAAASDALDELDRAMQGYQAVITNYPNDLVAIQAKLALALVYEAKMQPANALKIYDELIKSAVAAPTIWDSEVRLRHYQLLQRHPELEPKPVVAPAASLTPMAPGQPATVLPAAK